MFVLIAPRKTSCFACFKVKLCHFAWKMNGKAESCHAMICDECKASGNR